MNRRDALKTLGTAALLAGTKVPAYGSGVGPTLSVGPNFKDAGLEVRAWMWTMVCLLPDGGASGVSIFDAGAMSPARWDVFAKAIRA